MRRTPDTLQKHRHTQPTQGHRLMQRPFRVHPVWFAETTPSIQSDRPRKQFRPKSDIARDACSRSTRFTTRPALVEPIKM